MSDDNWLTERWVYGGVRPGNKWAKAAVWYDANREPATFKPKAGQVTLVIGGVYQVEALRNEEGHITTARLSNPEYVGRHDDTSWIAELEAGHQAGQIQIAMAARQRSDARRSELDKLIAPLEDLAARFVSPADRDALAMYVTRRIQTARARRRTA